MAMATRETVVVAAPLPRRRRRTTNPSATTSTTTSTATPHATTVNIVQSTSRGRGRARGRGQTRGRGRGRGSAFRAPKSVSSSGIWWLMGQFQVSSTTPSGPLELMVLHPTTFPGTPYAAMCMHHTHRIEHRWELNIEITTATTTGARVAVFALPDPDWNPGTIPPEMVWGSCLNGMGTLATVTGTGQHRSRFVMTTSTRRLSNAVPPTSNYLGYAAAVIVVYLLEKPIALTSTGALTITVMARVSMQVVNPIPGFLAFATAPMPGPGPEPHPTTAAWSIQIANSKATTNIPSTWYNSHTGSAWLAGGIYLKLPDTRPTSGDYIVSGNPRGFTVYTLTVNATNWHNNRGTTRTPKYFTTWYEPLSSVCQIVGFEQLENAINQAKGETGLIPSGVESCLIYSGTPKSWSTYFTLNVTGANTIGFVEHTTTSKSAPVYPTTAYEVAQRGLPVNLPPRQRDIPLDSVVMGEGVATIMTESRSSSPQISNTSDSLDPFNDLSLSLPQPLMSQESLSHLLTRPPVTFRDSFTSPIRCLQDSSLLEEEGRCDALQEEEIDQLMQRLQVLTGVVPRLPGIDSVEESFEVIPRCPGCMDPRCDWCFEDADSEV